MLHGFIVVTMLIIAIKAGPDAKDPVQYPRASSARRSTAGQSPSADQGQLLGLNDGHLAKCHPDFTQDLMSQAGAG